MKRLMNMTIGMALGAVLTLGTAVVAQQAPPAAPAAEEEEAEPAQQQAEPAGWEVSLPKWGEVKTREWKPTEAGNFADSLQVENLPETTWIAFAKLDGSAPCSDSANCKGWFESLGENSRKAALTRLASALANSFSSLGFDKAEVTEMGFTGLVEKIGENRALLAVARLQRDTMMHVGTLYEGVHDITDNGREVRKEMATKWAIEAAAERLENLREQATELYAKATTILTSVNEQGISPAVKSVREKRYNTAKAKYDAKVKEVEAAQLRLTNLERALAGQPPLPATPPAAPGSGSGVVGGP